MAILAACVLVAVAGIWSLPGRPRLEPPATTAPPDPGSGTTPGPATSTTAGADSLWLDPPPPGDPTYHARTVPPFDGSGPTVAVLGDSITFFNQSSLAPVLRRAGYAASITGFPGYQLATMKPWIDLYAASAPDVVIVNLVTNDVGEEFARRPGFSLDRFEQRVAALRQAFPHSCVVFSTTTSHRTAASFDHGTAEEATTWDAIAKRYDAFIRTLPRVIDWDAAVGAHPDFVTDGVHPFGSDAGQAALAALTLQAAEACHPA